MAKTRGPKFFPKKCVECGERFTVPEDEKRGSMRTLCSPACREIRRRRASRISTAKRRAVERAARQPKDNPAVCPECQRPFTRGEVEKTKICSDDCRRGRQNNRVKDRVAATRSAYKLARSVWFKRGAEQEVGTA